MNTRPPTVETIAELAEHAARHRAQIIPAIQRDGIKYAIAHSISAVGLWLAKSGHASLDRQDNERGYR